MGTEELGESYLRSQIIPEFIDSFLVVLLEVPSLLHLLIVMKGIEDDGIVLNVQLKVHFCFLGFNTVVLNVVAGLKLAAFSAASMPSDLPLPSSLSSPAALSLASASLSEAA